VNPQATLDARTTADSRGKGGKAGKGNETVQRPLALRVDWARLPGHAVEVWLQGEYIAAGVVEQATEDDSVLWIAGEGICTRRLFDKSSGYQVWV